MAGTPLGDWFTNSRLWSHLRIGCSITGCAEHWLVHSTFTYMKLFCVAEPTKLHSPVFVEANEHLLSVIKVSYSIDRLAVLSSMILILHSVVSFVCMEWFIYQQSSFLEVEWLFEHVSHSLTPCFACVQPIFLLATVVKRFKVSETFLTHRMRLVVMVQVICDLVSNFVVILSGFVCPKLFVVLVDRIPVDLFARAKG